MRPDAHALLAGYAVNALEPDERRAVDEHLAVCEVCRGDLVSLREAAAALATSVAASPPPGLKARVLAEIRRTPQERVGRGMPADALSGRSLSRAVLGLAASLVVLLVVAGTTIGVLASRLHGARADSVAASVLQAPDVRVVHGAAAAGGGSATLTLLSSAGRHAAVLVADGLPAAPAGKAWQAWFLTGTQARSAGLLDPQRPASRLTGSPGSANAVAVTLEPAGGSPQPTSTPVAVVTLT